MSTKKFLLLWLLGIGVCTNALGQTLAVESFSYQGSGCPTGSAAYNVAPDGQALTVLFDQYLAEASDLKNMDRKDCRLNFGLRIPPGWSVALFCVDYCGYADMVGDGQGVQASSYRFGNGPVTPMGSNLLQAPQSDDYFFRSLIPLSAMNWSPCSTGHQPFEINTSMVAKARDGVSFMTVDSVDGKFSQHYGLKWRRCDPNDPDGKTRRVVSGFYTDILKRPGSLPEIDHWALTVRNEADVPAVASGILNSEENARQTIVESYRKYLRRDPLCR